MIGPRRQNDAAMRNIFPIPNHTWQPRVFFMAVSFASRPIRASRKRRDARCRRMVLTKISTVLGLSKTIFDSRETNADFRVLCVLNPGSLMCIRIGWSLAENLLQLMHNPLSQGLRSVLTCASAEMLAISPTQALHHFPSCLSQRITEHLWFNPMWSFAVRIACYCQVQMIQSQYRMQLWGELQPKQRLMLRHLLRKTSNDINNKASTCVASSNLRPAINLQNNIKGWGNWVTNRSQWRGENGLARTKI